VKLHVIVDCGGTLYIGNGNFAKLIILYIVEYIKF